MIRRKIIAASALVALAFPAAAYDLPQGVVSEPTERDYGYMIAGMADCAAARYYITWSGKEDSDVQWRTLAAFKEEGSMERLGASEWNVAKAWYPDACQRLVKFYPTFLLPPANMDEQRKRAKQIVKERFDKLEAEKKRN